MKILFSFFKEKQFRKQREKEEKKSEKGESSADVGLLVLSRVVSSHVDEIGKDDVEAGFDAYSDQLAKGLLDNWAEECQMGKMTRMPCGTHEDDEVEEQDGQDNEDEEMESTNNAKFDEDADFESI